MGYLVNFLGGKNNNDLEQSSEDKIEVKLTNYTLLNRIPAA